jgi:hypothetical protein
MTDLYIVTFKSVAFPQQPAQTASFRADEDSAWEIAQEVADEACYDEDWDLYEEERGYRVDKYANVISVKLEDYDF